MPIVQTKKGDTLFSLADQYNLDPQKILEANLGVNKLYPGMGVNIPEPFGKIADVLGGTAQNLGNFFGGLPDVFGQSLSNAFDFGKNVPARSDYVLPDFMQPTMAPPTAPQAGPLIANVPQATAISTPVSQGAQRFEADRFRTILQNAVNGKATWPQSITADQLSAAYPGWTKDKEAQAMAAAGYTFDAATSTYVRSDQGQGQSATGGGGIPEEVYANPKAYGLTRKQLTKRQKFENWAAKGASGKIAQQAKANRASKWGYRAWLYNDPHIRANFRLAKQRGEVGTWEQYEAKLKADQAAQARQAAAQKLLEEEQQSAQNGPAGAVGLVWRAGT